MIVDVIQKYIEYTPAKAIYDKVFVDVQEVIVAKPKEAYRNYTNTGTNFAGDTFAASAIGSTLAIMVFALIFGLVVFVLNIMGICAEFKCKQVALGVVSIIGLLFGIPIGAVYYFVYLCHPEICK